MAYIKRNINNEVLPDTATHVNVRCGGYNIYNKKYKRSNLIGGGDAPNQPDILQGWNADYVPVTPGKATSKQTVEQTVYIKSDVNCVDITSQWECYKRITTADVILTDTGIITEAAGILYIQTEEGTPNYPSLIIKP